MPRMVERQEFNEKVRASPHALRDVRKDVSQYLRAAGLTSVEGDVLLVVTELLSNVAKHVGTDADAEIRLVPKGPVAVEVMVSDHSPSTPRVKAPDWDSESGRGMWLVQALDPHWYTVITDGGKSVVATVAAPTVLGVLP